MTSDISRTSGLFPAIRRAKIDQLDIYEISEAELQALERGSPESLYLNIGISLLSIAIAFMIALLTTTIESDRLFSIFVIITSVSFIGACILMLVWRKNRHSNALVLQQIRRRMPPEGMPLYANEVINIPVQEEGGE